MLVPRQALAIHLFIMLVLKQVLVCIPLDDDGCTEVLTLYPWIPLVLEQVLAIHLG